MLKKIWETVKALAFLLGLIVLGPEVIDEGLLLLGDECDYEQ